MNRRARRAAAANADGIAASYAACTYDYDQHGKRVLVDSPKAVKALKRAFSIMLKAGCEPQAVRITRETARAFPNADRQPPEAAPYLAVGLDKEGRGTYSLRYIKTPGAPAAIEDMCNRQAALRCLEPHTATAGFPKTAEAKQ